jgi:hypothetical protein
MLLLNPFQMVSILHSLPLNDTQQMQTKETNMKRKMSVIVRSVLATATFVAVLPSQAKDNAVTDTVPVRMIVTADVADGKRAPEITQQDVVVKKGKERLQVAEWLPAKGDSAALELFILIDDASDASLGSQLNEVRAFIDAQPSTTTLGVGYMRSGTVQIVQDFTTDHALASKAVRMPTGSVGAYGSPFLSVIDLMKRWPASSARHEIVMVTDGIDRARRGRNALLNPDIDTAISVAQRTGTMVHTIYAPGVGRSHRNSWEATTGQNGIARLSDETGGESFFLGLQSAVSFQPYLNALKKILDNQYLLTVSAKPGNKAGLQYVNLSTEVPGVELDAADAVWVPAAK